MQQDMLRLENVSKSFGASLVLDGIDLGVAAGEFCVIVGGSGCGKSTLLRTVAGLEEIDSGAILIDGQRVDTLPPAARGIAMVFQSYALYPHLTVFENMAFALRLAKVPDSQVHEKVGRAASILALGEYLDRKPAALSGGQRQRVAIGRAIVREPKLFLFDEPLSNLDASLRNRMRFEFAELHRQLGTTTLYVTHDQVEAMTLADRIVVMQSGRIEQSGKPSELYERPANRFVAGFIGSPQMNFIDGTIRQGIDGHARLNLSSGEQLPLPAGLADDLTGQEITLGVRPEHWRPDAEAGLALQARFIERLGASANIHLDSAIEGAQPVIWHQAEPVRIKEGETVRLAPDPAYVHLFDANGVTVPLH